jgi:putative addiction module component (TIGR02574 family)
MTEAAERIKSELSQLPQADRAALAGFLLSTLEESDADAEAAWDVELARRLEDIREGRVEGIPADKVFAKLREKQA